jgi:hypothetical protein
VAFGPVVERVEQPFQLEVCERDDVAQTAREERVAVAHRRPAANQLDADLVQRVEIERCSFRGSDELGSRQTPRAGEVLDLVVALVPHTGGMHPPENVTAAVHPGQAYVFSDRQRDRSPGSSDLGRELHTGRGCPDHEHTAVAQPIGGAVLQRGELLNALGHLGCEARERRQVAGSAGDHDRARSDLTLVAEDAVAVFSASQRGHGGAGANGSVDVRGKSLDQLDDLGRAHVPVGFGAVVGKLRQPAGPVGRQQRQRVPALPPPRVGQLTALEHDMVKRRLSQEVAGGEPCVPAADDDNSDALDGSALVDRYRNLGRVGECVEHGRALLRLGDEALDLLL